MIHISCPMYRVSPTTLLYQNRTILSNPKFFVPENRILLQDQICNNRSSTYHGIKSKSSNNNNSI